MLVFRSISKYVSEHEHEAITHSTCNLQINWNDNETFYYSMINIMIEYLTFD